MKKIASAAAAGIGLIGAAALAADVELTVVSWGGAYSASQLNAYHKPYMEAHADVKILNDDSSPQAVPKLRAMNEAGNVSWDLVDVVPSDAIRLCDEGLALEIDFDRDLAPAPDGTPASADFGDSLVSPCFIPQIVYSTTFGYRTDVAEWGGKKPTSIADIFDLKNFPGKRSLAKWSRDNLEWALIADGVAPGEVYEALSTEEGVARAFRKLDTIKDHVVWWSSGSETPQRLADGEVVIGSTFNGRLFDLVAGYDSANAKASTPLPVAMMWDAQIFELDGWIIPKGTPNLDAVKKFVRFATDAQRLADQAKYISYGPARQSSGALVGKHAILGIDMGPHMPTHPDNTKNVVLHDHEWWADHRDELDARFEAWLAR